MGTTRLQSSGGGTGRAGWHVVDAPRVLGADAVSLSRRDGVDVTTGDGLDAALAGVQRVDVSNAASSHETEAPGPSSRPRDGTCSGRSSGPVSSAWSCSRSSAPTGRRAVTRVATSPSSHPRCSTRSRRSSAFWDGRRANRHSRPTAGRDPRRLVGQHGSEAVGPIGLLVQIVAAHVAHEGIRKCRRCRQAGRPLDGDALTLLLGRHVAETGYVQGATPVGRVRSHSGADSHEHHWPNTRPEALRPARKRIAARRGGRSTCHAVVPAAHPGRARHPEQRIWSGSAVVARRLRATQLGRRSACCL